MITTSMSTIILVAVIVLVAVAAVIWTSVHRKRQSARLQKQYGAEYDRAVLRLGSQSKAEAELRKREARVAKLNITPLTAQEAARFSQAWSRLQGHFVDNPRSTVTEADVLIRELMTARGYPVSDFESRAADISVDHPGVVEAYRAAQAIAIRNARGEADTEELRKAIVHYRTLFSDLLEIHATPGTETPKPTLAVHS
jgi:predicted nucleic acid-binding protein